MVLIYVYTKRKILRFVHTLANLFGSCIEHPLGDKTRRSMLQVVVMVQSQERVGSLR